MTRDIRLARICRRHGSASVSMLHFVSAVRINRFGSNGSSNRNDLVGRYCRCRLVAVAHIRCGNGSALCERKAMQLIQNRLTIQLFALAMGIQTRPHRVFRVFFLVRNWIFRFSCFISTDGRIAIFPMDCTRFICPSIADCRRVFAAPSKANRN